MFSLRHCLLTLLFTSLFSVSACHLPGQWIGSFGPGEQLVNFRAAASGKRGVPIPVTVYFVGGSSCYVADWARADVDSEQRVVTLKGATRFDGAFLMGDCLNAIMYLSIVTHFTPQTAGAYTIKASLRPLESAFESTYGSDHLRPTVTASMTDNPQPIEFSQTINVTE
ncbi:MAG: hypothetical protein JWM96_1396 [Alphaproteobacteria bacterium]|nr:hypothetical protein [Alphaproteobacteria bacterium]